MAPLRRPSGRLSMMALDWAVELYGDPCRECGFRWTTTTAEAVALVTAAAGRYATIAGDVSGTAQHPDLGWSASGYVSHVVDNLQIWAERLAAAALGGDCVIRSYDSDLLAQARGYNTIDLRGALWSLERATDQWAAAMALALEAQVELQHPDRGLQRAGDVAASNAHDTFHHAWDLERIVGPFSATAVRAAYDVVAAKYADAFGDELAGLPVDREMLDAAFAAIAHDPGWILEAGCGPAPAARYLGTRASKLVGLDMSEAMLKIAGARHHDLPVVQGDLRRLPFRDNCFSLIIAYYSLHHLPREEIGSGLKRLRRLLSDRGLLLVATHLGTGDVTVDDFLGQRVRPFGGALYQRDELLAALIDAGFAVEREETRGPQPDEYDSQRIYLLARAIHGAQTTRV